MTRFNVWQFDNKLGTIVLDGDKLSYEGDNVRMLKTLVRNAARELKQDDPAKLLPALVKQTADGIFTVVKEVD